MTITPDNEPRSIEWIDLSGVLDVDDWILLYAYLSFEPISEPPPSSFLFHSFISYTGRDSSSVELSRLVSALVAVLATGRDRLENSVFLDRHTLPYGRKDPGELTRILAECVERSCVFLCLLSKNYGDSNWCRLEFDVARESESHDCYPVRRVINLEKLRWYERGPSDRELNEAARSEPLRSAQQWLSMSQGFGKLASHLYPSAFELLSKLRSHSPAFECQDTTRLWLKLGEAVRAAQAESEALGLFYEARQQLTIDAQEMAGRWIDLIHSIRNEVELATREARCRPERKWRPSWRIEDPFLLRNIRLE